MVLNILDNTGLERVNRKNKQTNKCTSMNTLSLWQRVINKYCGNKCGLPGSADADDDLCLQLPRATHAVGAGIR